MTAVEQYEAVRAAYKRAEDAIHSLGIESTGVDTTALNELRYAGYHVLKAVTSAQEDIRDEQLGRAMRHCERALYEAYDSAIFYRLDQFVTFRDDYKNVVVSDVVDDYVGMIKKMQQARKFLESARSSNADRGQYYQEGLTGNTSWRPFKEIVPGLEAASKDNGADNDGSLTSPGQRDSLMTHKWVWTTMAGCFLFPTPQARSSSCSWANKWSNLQRQRLRIWPPFGHRLATVWPPFGHRALSRRP